MSETGWCEQLMFVFVPCGKMYHFYELWTKKKKKKDLSTLKFNLITLSPTNNVVAYVFELLFFFEF